MPICMLQQCGYNADWYAPCSGDWKGSPLSRQNLNNLYFLSDSSFIETVSLAYGRLGFIMLTDGQRHECAVEVLRR